MSVRQRAQPQDQRRLTVLPVFLSTAICCVFSLSAPAQELAPRTYWLAPVGASSAGLGVAYSNGDFVEDSYVPFEVFSGTIRSVQVNYYHSFALAGRTASLNVDLPWVDASHTGESAGEPVELDLSGPGDAHVRLAVNLVGGPAMTIEEIQVFRQHPRTLVGISLRIKAPTGRYDTDRAVNIGGNRWAFKPEVGLVHPVTPKILIELYAGLWIFTDNDDHLGQTLEQDPLSSGELHLVYRLRPGLWLSADLNLFSGGRTFIGGIPQPNSFQNSRLGVTLSIPFRQRNTFRIGLSTPLTTDFGGDYEALILGFQHGWL